MVKIRESKAPQVLKIDHDDAISLSGDSEVDTDEEEEMFPPQDSDMDVLQRMSQENEPGEDINSKILPSGLALSLFWLGFLQWGWQ